MENENKFDMFASLADRDFMDIENEEVEVVSVTAKAEGNSAKKLRTNAIVRSQEEYDSFVESVHFETMTHPTTGQEYQVKVTVLKPEVNPLENMRPVFAYSTNH